MKDKSPTDNHGVNNLHNSIPSSSGAECHSFVVLPAPELTGKRTASRLARAALSKSTLSTSASCHRRPASLKSPVPQSRFDCPASRGHHGLLEERHIRPLASSATGLRHPPPSPPPPPHPPLVDHRPAADSGLGRPVLGFCCRLASDNEMGLSKPRAGGNRQPCSSRTKPRPREVIRARFINQRGSGTMIAASFFVGVY